MDRRMYRSNMGNTGRNISRRRPAPGCRDDFKESIRNERCDGLGHKCDDLGRKRDDRCDGHEHMHDDRCDGHKKKCAEDIDRFPIGMCYVPWQCFRNLYDNEFTALANGTLFKELDLKWYGRSCK